MPLVDLQQHVDKLPEVFAYLGGTAELKFEDPAEEAEIRE